MSSKPQNVNYGAALWIYWIMETSSWFLKVTVLKMCMLCSKMEKAFYADRIRINGERLKKKSQSVNEGDEVDFIIRYNKKTPEYLDVSRVEILKLGPYPSIEDDDEPVVPAKIKRSRNLIIENYTVPFRGNIDED